MFSVRFLRLLRFFAANLIRNESPRKGAKDERNYMNVKLPCLFLLASGLTARADDQPQWGQAWSRNMISAEKNLPAVFDPKSGRNIKWSAALGTETHSTPVVAGGRVYIGTNNGQPRDPNHQG